MNRIHWLVLWLSAAAGCVDNQTSLVLLQNQVPDRNMMNCGVPTTATPTARPAGVLDVGMVEGGYNGYVLYPLVRNDLIDRANPMGGLSQRSVVSLQGADIQLIVSGNLAAALPPGQRNFYQPSFGGAAQPNGGTAAMVIQALPRQVVLQLAGAVSGGEPDFPTVIVRFRAVGRYASDSPTQGDTLASGWIDFPVRLCRWCLTGGPPAVCTQTMSAKDVRLGACNVSQDDPVTCCVGGNSTLLCGPFVPVTNM